MTNCPNDGNPMYPIKEYYQTRIPTGERVKIHNVDGFECPECGKRFFTGTAIGRAIGDELDVCPTCNYPECEGCEPGGMKRGHRTGGRTVQCPDAPTRRVGWPWNRRTVPGRHDWRYWTTHDGSTGAIKRRYKACDYCGLEVVMSTPSNAGKVVVQDGDEA